MTGQTQERFEDREDNTDYKLASVEERMRTSFPGDEAAAYKGIIPEEDRREMILDEIAERREREMATTAPRVGERPIPADMIQAMGSGPIEQAAGAPS